MTVIASSILKYSLVSLGVGSSAVFPLVYSSSSKGLTLNDLTSKVKRGSTAGHEDIERKMEEESESTPHIATDSSQMEKENTKILQTSGSVGKDLKRVKMFGNTETLPLNSGKMVKDAKIEKAYKGFLGSLWNILRSTLWVDEKFGTPWVFKVSSNLGENKTLLNSKVDISITQDDIQFMRTGDPNNLVKNKREEMADLLKRFCFSPSWEKFEGESELQPVLCSFGGVSVSNLNNKKVNILTLKRTENDKEYFLEIYFNTNKESHNSLLVQYVSYKDKSWWSSGFYQANGDYGNYRRHIGGNIEKDSKLGFSITSIDREFDSMFGNRESSSTNLYKLITSISNCLGDKECSIMFHRAEGDYQELAQRTPGVSRWNSWNPEKYKYIHPFSRKYWEVDKTVNLNPEVYSQFLNFTPKDLKSK